MRVRALFFGPSREAVGEAERTLEVAAGATAASLLPLFPELEKMSPSLVLAVNAQFVPRSTELRDGDEIAFLPPVSGGAGEWLHVLEDAEGHFFALTRAPLDARALAARLQRPDDGAVATFEGVVRNNTKGRQTLYLEYEGYLPMALETMARIGREIAATHAIGRIGMIHRLGRMEIGEASVVICVSAPHRKPAFDACLEGINRLKKLVPIYKKEHFADGSVWVEGEWDPSVLSS